MLNYEWFQGASFIAKNQKNKKKTKKENKKEREKGEMIITNFETLGMIDYIA